MSHARLTPSARHRWGVCPGSVREEAKYPSEGGGGPAATDGTHSHTLLEKCIKGGLIDPTRLIGQSFTDHDGTFTVDADRAARVKVAIDYISARTHGLGTRAKVIPEEKVNPKAVLGREDLTGTVDVQLELDDVLEIIDYKDGMNPVDAVGNLQLEQYAYGALAKWGIWELIPFKTIRMTIVQPKLALKGGDAIGSCEILVEDLFENRSKILFEAHATDDPDAALVPGEKQCRFCRAKGACSALADSVMKEVGLMFQPTAAPQALDMAQQGADKNPTVMSEDEIRQVLEAAPLVRQFIEAVETEAQRRLEAGQSIPGFKLVHGRGSRAWSLPDDQMAERLVKMGIPKASVYETKLISVAKAEKVQWTKRDGTKAQLSDRQLKTLNGEYVTKSSGKLTVAPESDSRDAVVVNAAPMFAPIAPPVEELALPAWLM
jgi:hypothetical protein